MRLPANVARCGGKAAKPCETCARRLSPSNHPWQPWMTPPESVGGHHDWCGFWIENVEVTK